ncbi:hypothetical protein BGZ61DRAFT_93013 [Ilyonectria robusta]|uniref:uncharacterized protein n=1 Tax=Ilyonectria robusta TaxID=1079257 RepID=UPI001E8CAE11|nr:uncharacterized protein BGZ61DRAFT_93013 [Ilyonectria robusta]KAH8736328.1 hypothetical protein BGZ61DRAFT_93013 [Ilyonectria robusta]
MPVPMSGLLASSRGVAHWLFSRRAWLDNGISCILEPARASIQGHVTSEQPLWCGEGHRIPCPSPRSSVALCKPSTVAEMREHCPNPITQHLHSQGAAHDWTLGAVVEAANFSPSLADSAASRSSVPRSSQPVSDRVGPKTSPAEGIRRWIWDPDVSGHWQCRRVGAKPGLGSILRRERSMQIT